MSWRIEDRRGLKEAIDAVDSSRGLEDMVVMDRKTHALVSSFGMEIVKVASHSFAQAWRMFRGVKMESGRARNTVLPCANVRVKLEEPLFEVAAGFDASGTLDIWRPINSSLVSAMRPRTGCIELTGILRRG